MKRWLKNIMQCPERAWPELQEPAFRCLERRWHTSTHRDGHGDTWEGKRR